MQTCWGHGFCERVGSLWCSWCGGHFEVCLSKDVCDKGSLFAYICETGPFLLQCLGCFLPYGSVVGGFVRINGEGIVV